ncbi:MAG: hypothetical protein LN413_00385 [Candidatus Thermoplasmatota archaeon]|nr:hypothetical protein [Candidatus Thermoplasmatota archaeon]
MMADLDFEQLYAILGAGASIPLVYRELVWAKVVYDEPPTPLGLSYGVSPIETEGHNG